MGFDWLAPFPDLHIYAGSFDFHWLRKSLATRFQQAAHEKLTAACPIRPSQWPRTATLRQQRVELFHPSRAPEKLAATWLNCVVLAKTWLFARKPGFGAIFGRRNVILARRRVKKARRNTILGRRSPKNGRRNGISSRRSRDFARRNLKFSRRNAKIARRKSIQADRRRGVRKFSFIILPF
jgi:hypothetical protein